MLNATDLTLPPCYRAKWLVKHIPTWDTYTKVRVVIILATPSEWGSGRALKYTYDTEYDNYIVGQHYPLELDKVPDSMVPFIAKYLHMAIATHQDMLREELERQLYPDPLTEIILEGGDRARLLDELVFTDNSQTGDAVELVNLTFNV